MSSFKTLITTLTATLVSLACLMIAGCVSPGVQQHASNEISAEAKRMDVSPSMSRIYFYHGVVNTTGCLFGGCSPSDYIEPIDFYINGANIGSLNQKEFFSIDLHPGTYRLSWKARVKSGPMASAEPVSVTLQAGEMVFARASITMPVNSQGLIGALTIQPKASIDIGGEAGKKDLDKRALVIANEDGLKTLLSESMPQNVTVTSPAPTQVQPQLVKTDSGVKASLNSAVPETRPMKPASVGQSKIEASTLYTDNSSVSIQDVGERLRRLNALFKEGLISKSEFDSKKREILKSM